MTDLDHRVQIVLSEVFDIPIADINADTSPDTVEAWDSLQHLSLILALEEEFKVVFDDTEVPLLMSYSLIVMIVGERLSALGA